MEHVLIGGDYVPNGCGGLRRAEGVEALLCRALFCLCCRRGSFPFLPELGSRLWTLRGQKREQMEALAMAYAAEAVAHLGLRVHGVTVLEMNGSSLRLDIQLGLQDSQAHLEVKL